MKFDKFVSISTPKNVSKALNPSGHFTENDGKIAYDYLKENNYVSISCKTYTDGHTVIDLLSSIVPHEYKTRSRNVAFEMSRNQNIDFNAKCKNYGDYSLSTIFDNVRIFKHVLGPVICVSPYVPKDFRIETQKCLNALCSFFCIKYKQLPFSFYGQGTCSILFTFDIEHKQDEFFDLMCQGLTIKDKQPKE